ncbi:MAG: M56 family metallopeptidase [Gemmatimonadetes bacterium]|nr:M56 family metallopeptidase [Gemmatimonadota bacterium]
MSGAAEVLGRALLHSMWQGALVAAGLWLVLRVAGPSLVRVRYVAGLLALVALLALPVLNYRATMTLWTGHRSWVLSTADGILRAELAAWGRAEVGEVREELRRREATEWAGGALPARDPGDRDLARLLGLLWVAAAGLLVARLAVEQRGALRLAESGVPNEGWRRSATALAERLGVRSRTRVRVTDRVEVPALVGWLWPVVLVPTAAAGLPEEERDAVLAHELAHVARADYLANLLQSVAESLLFYSPAAWWISARIREERECCCDRTALEAVPGGPARYARALLSLETGRARGHARAALALTGGPLLRRIHRIHAVATRQRPPGRARGVATLLLAGCLGTAVAAVTPDVAARRSAGALMAGDIESVRLVLVPAAAARPGSPPPPPAACTGAVLSDRA